MLLSLGYWEGGNGEEFFLKNENGTISLFSFELIDYDEENDEENWDEKHLISLTEENKNMLISDIERAIVFNKRLNNEEYIQSKSEVVLDMLHYLCMNEGSTLSVCYG